MAFCPDAERSQYFPFPPAPPMEESAKGSFEKQVDELGVEAADSDFCKVEWPEVSSEQLDVVDLISESDSSDSESGDSCIASEDSFVFQPATKRSKVLPREEPGTPTEWFAHRKSGLLHLCWSEPSGGDDNRKMSACGRTITDNYVAMDRSTDGGPQTETRSV